MFFSASSKLQNGNILYALVKDVSRRADCGFVFSDIAGNGIGVPPHLLGNLGKAAHLLIEFPHLLFFPLRDPCSLCHYFKDFTSPLRTVAFSMAFAIASLMYCTTLPFFVFSLIFAIDTHPFFLDASMTFSHAFSKLCAFLCAFFKFS